MKKRILFVVTLCMTLFLVTSCLVQKEILTTPQNVKVSASGLVTWNAVDNAEKYYVVYENEETSKNVTVTETKYQLEDTESAWTITVTAKASKYSNSNASEPIEFVSENQEVIAELTELFIENFLGEKKPNLSAEASSRYDADAKYLKQAVKKMVSLGFEQDTVEEIVDMYASGSGDVFEVLTTTLNILNLYSDEEIISSLYFLEVALVGHLISVRNEYIVWKQASDEIIDGVIEAFQNADVDLVNHVYNIIKTAKELSSSLTPIIAQIVEIVEEFDTVKAEKIYTVKSNLVKALKKNLVNKEDLVYVFDFIGSLKGSVDLIADNIDADAAPWVTYALLIYKEISPFLDEIDNEELVTTIENGYVGFLDFIDGISKEFIENILSKETVEEMLVELVVSALQNLLPEASEIGKIDVDATFDMVNAIIKEIFGEDSSSITELLGLTEKQIKEYLEASANLEESLYECFYNIINDENIVEAVVKAMKYSTNTEFSYSETWDEIVPEYAKEFMEKYGIEKFGLEHSNSFYEIVEPIEVEGASATLVVKTLHVIVYYKAYGIVEELVIETTYNESKYIVNNANELLPLIKICVKEFLNCEEDLVAMLNVLIKALPSLSVLEGIIPSEVLDAVNKLDDKALDELVSVLFDLVDKALVYAETIDLNQLILMLSHTDYVEFSEFQALVQGFGTQENVKLIKNLISEIADVLETVEMIDEIGYESKTQFINDTNNAIDEFFGLTIE